MIIADVSLEALCSVLLFLSAAQLIVLTSIRKVLVKIGKNLVGIHEALATEVSERSAVLEAGMGSADEDDIDWVRDALGLLELGNSVEAVARKINQPVDHVRLVAQFRST